MAGAEASTAVTKLAEELRRAGGRLTEATLERLAAQIAAAFQARKDEVAILRLSPDGKMLTFLFPLKLSKIGAIPISSVHSLATKNIREGRGEIVNNFSAYRHPTVFEAVDLSEEEKAAPIQKIMSTPVMAEKKVLGVIQVSRKARPGQPVGPDFTGRDLDELTRIGTLLGRFLGSSSSLTGKSTIPSGKR